MTLRRSRGRPKKKMSYWIEPSGRPDTEFIVRNEDGVITKFEVPKGWEDRPIEVLTHEYSEDTVANTMDRLHPGSSEIEPIHYSKDEFGLPVSFPISMAHAAVAMHTKSGFRGADGKYKEFTPEEFNEFVSKTQRERFYPELDRIRRQWRGYRAELERAGRDRKRISSILAKMERLYSSSIGKVPESSFDAMRRDLDMARRYYLGR